MGRVYQNIRRSLPQRMRREAVTHAHGPEAGVTSGFNVDVRVTDDCGFFRTYSTFFEQLARAFGIGFLGRKTVAAINLCEERAQSQRFNDGTRRDHRLIREHGQLARRV